MDRRIGILMLILIAMPIALAGDWPQIGQNAVNTNNAGNSLGDSILYNAFNLTQTGGGYFPVSGTFNGDISLVVYDSGIIKLYSSNYSLISSVDGKSIVSTLFIFQGITPYYNKIIGFNSTDIFVWNTDSSAHIYEGGSASLPIPPAVLSGGTGNIYEMFPRPSMNCYGKQDIGYCVFQSNLTNIVGFSFNYTQDYPAVNVWNVSRAETQGTLKPALYPTSGLDNYAAFYCTQGGRYGVMLINMTTGSLVRENCTTAVDVPWGMPLVYNQDIIWNGNPASATEYLHRVNTLLKEVNGFPVTYGSAGQNAPWGLSLIGSSVYACMLNSANVNAIHKYNVDSVPPTHSVIGTWGVANILNFPPGIGNSAGGDYFSCMNVIYNIGTGGNQTINAGFPSLYGFYDGVDYIANSFTDGILRVYRAQAAPLSYPNITIAFRNNATGSLIDVIPFNITDTTGNVLYVNDITTDGTLFLGSYLGPGNYNVTLPMYINESGYVPFSKTFNVAAGTQTIYFNVTPLGGANTSINLVFYDTTTGKAPLTPISYSIHIINSTGGAIGSLEYPQLSNPGNPTIEPSVKISDVPSGNVSVYVTAPSYSPFFQEGYFCAGSCTIGVYMQPSTGQVTQPPFIAGYKLVVLQITQNRTYIGGAGDFVTIADDNTSCSSPYSIVNNSIVFDVTPTKNPCYGKNVSSFTYDFLENPPYICLNQSVYVDVNSIKQDNESYVVHIEPNYEFEPIVSNGAVKTTRIWLSPFKSVGNVSLLTYGLSKTWDLNSIVFYKSPFVKTIDFDVKECPGAIFDSNGNRLIYNAASQVPPNANTAQFNLLLGIVIWIIASLAIGAFISALISGGPMVFGIAAGIVGIGVSIILALPFIGWLPPYFTLILTIFDVAAIAISVRMGMTG